VFVSWVNRRVQYCGRVLVSWTSRRGGGTRVRTGGRSDSFESAAVVCPPEHWLSSGRIGRIYVTLCEVRVQGWVT